MDTEAGIMGETGDGSDGIDSEGIDRGPAGNGRPVRVSYEDRGFGVALVVGDDRADGVEGVDATETEAGVLRVSDAVVTLEIPLADGSRSVLTWDPAEVTVDPLVA